MAIKTYKPVTNGRRNMTSLTYEEITTNKPEKSLVAKNLKTVVVTTKVLSQHVIMVVDINKNTVLSISKEIKIMFQGKLQLLNMIQIDQQTSH